mgnify:FL=1
MKVDLVEIDNALKYYQINDINYKNKCYKCIDDLNSIKDFNNKAEEVYNILYKNNTIDTLWQKENEIELFGEQYNPFITSVLVLLGWKIHDKNMTNKNYTDTQKELYKKRVREALTNDIYVRKLESIRISQMIWAAYFINTKLIEVGRLQYERREDYIKIHIPSGEKLEIEKVLDSIQKAKVEIEKYLNLKNPEYHCDSWLLSNQINAIIDSNSNIAKFYSLFDVKDGPDATKAILNFVFKLQECDDYNNLPEHTSLQRILKKQLLEKKELKIGCGKLKNRNLKECGKD